MKGFCSIAHRKGFTIVEIMIAVAIIGLISAIAIPSYRVIRARSLSVIKATNAGLVNDAVDIWAMDNYLLDGAPIGATVTNYIKGGFQALQVGEVQPNLAGITGRTVGHVFTAADLY